ncbi:unnamed protein product [Lymnaea stagnalis]|uniref:C1q domain-containing protein n=1 Tax=Lymnaea stagnalis TaxID=6523 RepID=A0AAV2HY03_LYMST
MNPRYRLLLLLTVCLVTVDEGHAVHLELSPNTFEEGVTDHVDITCVPDGTGILAKEILLMEISKGGETPIVNIQPPTKINYEHNLDGRFGATGLINNSYIPDSHISLRIQYPTREDAGIYTCVMSYLGETGLLKQDRDRADLIIKINTNASLEDKVGNMQKSLDNLLVRIKAVEATNQILLADSRNQSQQIQTLREKVEYTAAFSAAVRQEKNIVTGDVIVFGDVMLNEGQGYNETTGLFTAPVPGLYAFHLVLEIGQGGAVGEIFLNVAGKDQAKMYTQDKDFGDQGSVSVIQRLKKGDVVKAVVFLASGVTPRILAEKLCVFSGILIKS